MLSDQINIVSPERHSGKKWLSRADYRWAAKMQAVPVASSEFADSARTLPLAFVQQAGSWALVALMGLARNSNLFVARDGRWLGSRVPATLRSYPFRLARAGNDTVTLCVDEASGLVTDLAAAGEGTPFFGSDGKLHPETQRMAEAVVETQRGLDQTRKLAALLAEHGVLEPWPLKVRDGEAELVVNGIWCVSEAKLNALGPAELVALRDAGALAVAYGQLVSMGNIAVLGQLVQFHRQQQGGAATRAPVAAPPAAAATASAPVATDLPADARGDLKIDWNEFFKDR